jgi:NADPH:quinone reductase
MRSRGLLRAQAGAKVLTALRGGEPGCRPPARRIWPSEIIETIIGGILSAGRSARLNGMPVARDVLAERGTGPRTDIRRADEAADMLAVTIPRFGSADVLTLEDVHVPEPGPNQVAIDVTHAAVGLADVLMRRGELGGTPPIIPGLEVAGRVRALGDQVAGLRVGQPVVTLSRPTAGGYAQVTLADAAITFPLDELPAMVDPALAVAVVPNATTALLALEEVAHLRAGERVLIHGATGALASIVGQIARQLGAGQVIGTVRSADRFQDAQRAGLDTVLESADFADTLAQRGLDAIDVIIDPVGGPLRAESLKVLAPLGRLLAVGNASGESDVPIGANHLWLSNAGVLGFNIGGLLSSHPDRGSAAGRRALEFLAAGRITCDHAALPLDGAADAHRRLEGGGLSGRIILTVDQT